MLMAVNIGNSRIFVGIFKKSSDGLIAKFQIATDLYKSSDEYSNLILSMLRERDVVDSEIDAGIIASVVPQLTETLRDAMIFVTKKEPLIVGPGVKTGFPIRIDNPSELGGDIVADIAAVIHSMKQKGKKPAVVAHVGTVTTVSAINAKGEFVGCSIFPGIRLSLETLHGKTAQLPNVSLSVSEYAIAKNSQDAVRSGVIRGHALMLDGFMKKFAEEMKCRSEEMVCFLTGRDAKYVMDCCSEQFSYDEDLTLRGLYRLFCNTVAQL